MGRKTFVVANINIDELDLTGDRTRELHDEVRFLRNELQVMADRLASAESMKQLPDLRSNDENIYVFDEEDEVGAAFDDFFSTPDPHLDKVRGFLLD